MATYSIRTQTDLEEMASKGLTAANTFILQNDITCSNWTRINRTWAGAVLDGNGYSISGITSRGIKFITGSNTANTASLAATMNFGQTHTMSWIQAPSTGTGQYMMFGISVNNGNGVWWNSNGQLAYYCDGGWGVFWNLARPTVQTAYTIIRTGTSLTLYVNGSSQGSKTLGAFGKVFTMNSFLIPYLSGSWTSGIAELVITSDAKDSTYAVNYANNALGRYNTTTNTTNVVGLWHLDEGTGTTSTATVGQNVSGIDGWSFPQYRAGFIDVMNSGTIKNLTLDTPNNTSTETSSVQIGNLVNTMNNGTIEKCYVKDATLSAAFSSFGRLGGLVGIMWLGTIQNCYSKITSCPPFGGNLYWGSGGIVGRCLGGLIDKCYSTGGGAGPATKPDCGIAGDVSGTTTISNCFATVNTTKREVSFWSDTPGTQSNCYYYDRSQGGSNKAGTTAVATLADFYNVTQAPMDTWDFTATGPWSTTQDTVTYPPFKARFLADISGTVTSYSSGKEIALTIPKMTAGMVNSGAGDASVTSFDLGTVFTIAFTADITVSKNTVLQSSVTNSMIGLDLGSVTIASGGSASNLSFTGTGYGLHRWVITRSTNQYYVYRDGVQVASQNTAILGSLTQFDRVFRGDYPYNNYTTAKYGEIFISSDAKSASWVTDDWTLATRPGWNGKYYYTSEANITHLWHFDEGTGTTATDLVGGNTITIPTPTWSTSVLCAELKTRVDTTGSGDFAFTGVDSMYGTPVLFFINGETVKGALLTNLTEGTTAVTGVTMEQDTMVIGDTNLNPSVTYATANIVAPTATTDYCFRATSNILYYRDGCDVLIPTSCTYSNYAIRQDTSETGSITIAGTFGGTTPVLESPTSITISGTTGTGWVPMDNATCDVTVSGYSKIQSNGAGIRDLTIASGGEASCFGNILGDLDNQGTFHSQGIHFYGDINNDGTWDGGGNTWLMDDCTLTGTGITFNYLRPTPGKTYTFQDGETYTLADASSDLSGTVGSLVTFRSTTPGTRFTIDNQSGVPLTYSYMDIQDSNVSTNDFNAKRSIDSGNTDRLSATPHWVFWEYQKGFRLNHN